MVLARSGVRKSEISYGGALGGVLVHWVVKLTSCVPASVLLEVGWALLPPGDCITLWFWFWKMHFERDTDV